VLVNPAAAYTQSLIRAAPGRDWDFANFRPIAPEPAPVLQNA
jgi:peptide/nickel transport system ATP-binding protein